MPGACDLCAHEGFVVLYPNPIPGIASPTPTLCIKCLEKYAPSKGITQESPPKE